MFSRASTMRFSIQTIAKHRSTFVRRISNANSSPNGKTHSSSSTTSSGSSNTTSGPAGKDFSFRSIFQQAARVAATTRQKVQEGTKVDPSATGTDKLWNNNIMKGFTGSLQDAKRSIIDNNAFRYGGMTSKAYRDRIRKQRLGEKAVASDEENSTVVEDPNAGANVVLHKDSKWRESWNQFKDSNPVMQNMLNMRRRYEESDNVLLNTSRVLMDRMRDMFGTVMEESEHAHTIAEIREHDPSFTVDRFMKDAREFMIPEVLEAFVDWNRNELKQWCSASVMSLLEASREPLNQKNLKVEGRILDLRQVELAAAKMIEDTPVLILSFKTQQTEVVRNAQGELVMGSPDVINDVFYLWAVVRETEKVNPLTQGWKVSEFVIQAVREGM